ncbi:MAG TPA: hypothetical protein VMU17_08005 [Elusimicrobiota bacterium]|nr:hypothetical protein [Elusimicrobiota bacterium]
MPLVVAAVVGFGAGTLLAGPMAGHPNLKAAMRSINKALEDCRRAHADERNGEFGGHRDKAEQLLAQAKAELEAAAQFANRHP